MYNPGLVILFGILTTIQLHIAKAMERQGIEIFDQIREKLKKDAKDPNHPPDVKKPVIYIVGLILNNTTVVYTILSQLYGPAALYTSTFGIGLIALMLYSHFVLHEPITQNEWFGSILIIIGTVIIGVEGLYRPVYDLATVDIIVTWVLLLIFFISSGIAIGTTYLRNKPIVTGFIFGFVAGACGGLDAVIKNIAMNMDGQPVIIPVSTMAWIFYILSYLIGFSAFMLTQWGFARQARASILVPAYNCMYIVIPLIFQTILLPEYHLFLPTFVGLASIVLGIWIMQLNKLSAL
jgi:drug/metabolite transporter (DMT)-like permease